MDMDLNVIHATTRGIKMIGLILPLAVHATQKKVRQNLNDLMPCISNARTATKREAIALSSVQNAIFFTNKVDK